MDVWGPSGVSVLYAGDILVVVEDVFDGQVGVVDDVLVFVDILDFNAGS